MLRLLRWLLWGDGHLHKWKILTAADMFRDGSRIGTNYHMQCVVCGNLKFRGSV